MSVQVCTNAYNPTAVAGAAVPQGFDAAVWHVPKGFFYKATIVSKLLDAMFHTAGRGLKSLKPVAGISGSVAMVPRLTAGGLFLRCFETGGKNMSRRLAKPETF